MGAMMKLSERFSGVAVTILLALAMLAPSVVHAGSPPIDALGQYYDQANARLATKGAAKPRSAAGPQSGQLLSWQQIGHWLDRREVLNQLGFFETLLWEGEALHRVDMAWMPDGASEPTLINRSYLLTQPEGYYSWDPVKRSGGKVEEILDTPRSLIVYSTYPTSRPSPPEDPTLTLTPTLSAADLIDVVESFLNASDVDPANRPVLAEDEVIDEAKGVAHMLAIPLGDGTMTGYLSQSLPLRLDVLLESASNLTTSTSTVGEAGLSVGDAEAPVVVLNASTVLGEIEVHLLPDMGAMPARVAITAGPSHLVDGARLDHLTPRGPLRRMDITPANLALPTGEAARTLYEVVEVVELDGIHLPKVAIFSSVNEFSDGSAVVSQTRIERESISIPSQKPESLEKDFPEGLRVNRSGGGPGIVEEWRDGAVRLRHDPDAVAAVDAAIASVAAEKPRNGGDGGRRVILVLSAAICILAVAGTATAIIVARRRRDGEPVA